MANCSTSALKDSIYTLFVYYKSALAEGIQYKEERLDHCSNIAGCIIETSHHNLNMHEGLRVIKSDSEDFKKKFAVYSNKYNIL